MPGHYDSYSVYDHTPQPGMESANQRVLRHLDGLHQPGNPIAQLHTMRRQENRRLGLYRPAQSIDKEPFTTNTVLMNDLENYIRQF